MISIPATQLCIGKKELGRLVGKLHLTNIAVPGAVEHL